MNAFRSLLIMISRIPPAALIALVLGIAGITSMLVTAQLDKERQDVKAKMDQIEREKDAQGTVVIALKDIPEGKPIASGDLDQKKIPLGKIPADALASPAMVAGRVSKYGIAQGQIVSQHDLAPIGLSADFESRLKKGMRAVTFAVDTNSGVAGFVTPDSHVDVLGMVGSGAETRVAPILSDVQVIAVGQVYQREAGASQAMPTNSVTVAINPEDAQKLVKAVAASKLYLSLRGQGDHAPLLTVDVTQLFPRKMEEPGRNQLADLPPPPSQDLAPSLPSPEFADQATTSAEAQEAAKIQPVNHEIEMWAASARQVINVAPGRN